MKKISLFITAMAVLTMFTACGKEELSGVEPPIDVYGNTLYRVTEPPVEETVEEPDETPAPNVDPTSNTAYNTREGYMRFVPQIKDKEIAKVETDLANFTIAGKEYNLLESNISDIIEGNKMTASTLQRSLTDNKDYYFKGDCFRQDNRDGVVEVYVQQMIDGEPVLGYDESMKNDYELFGVRIDALEDYSVTDEMMTFACGVKLYMTPHEVKQILGEGTKGDFGYLDYPTYYYKTDDVILAIVYTRYENNPEKVMRARQITLIRNIEPEEKE